jgi:hypothetical protein
MQLLSYTRSTQNFFKPECSKQTATGSHPQPVKFTRVSIPCSSARRQYCSPTHNRASSTGIPFLLPQKKNYVRISHHNERGEKRTAMNRLALLTLKITKPDNAVSQIGQNTLSQSF